MVQSFNYMLFSRKTRGNVPVVETRTPVEMARALKLISCWVLNPHWWSMPKEIIAVWTRQNKCNLQRLLAMLVQTKIFWICMNYEVLLIIKVREKKEQNPSSCSIEVWNYHMAPSELKSRINPQSLCKPTVYITFEISNAINKLLNGIFWLILRRFWNQ